MNKGKWIVDRNHAHNCPRCDGLIEELIYNDMVLGERCVRCKWQIDLSGKNPRRVAYSGV